MYVIKANGEKEEFKKEKIMNTLHRAGMTKKDSIRITNKISVAVKDGTRTRDIYKMILNEIEGTDKKPSFIFTIREALSEINPVSFELYVVKILESYSYKCEWNKLILGKYVEHQVDIVAKKNKENFLVEVKRHTNPHRFTGLGDCLQVRARFEDIEKGLKEKKNNYNFSSMWIVTNTKFSEHAKKYSSGIGIRLSGWGYKGNYAIENMISNRRLFPVTILKAKNDIKRKLLKKDIITIQDLIELNEKTRKNIMSEKEFNALCCQAKKLLM